MSPHSSLRRSLALTPHGGTMRVGADTLLDSLDAIVWEMDPVAWRFTFVSAGAERVLGYPAQQWVDDPDFWTARLHPDDRARADAECRGGVARGEDHELEYRMQAADGHVVWLRDLIRVVPGEGGAPPLLHGVMVDITAHKELEAELRASEERFARFSSASADAVFVHEQGRIVDINQAAAGLIGHPREALLGRSAFEFVLPGERATLLAHIASGSEAPLEGHLLTQAGAAIPIELRGRTVALGGSVARVVVIRDLREQRRAEEAMRSREAHLRMLLQQLPALLWTTDGELRSTSFVGRGLVSYGIDDPAQVVGVDFRILLGDHPDSERLMEAHRAALRGEAGTYTVTWRGTPFEAHVEPLRDASGAIVGVIGLGIDVSERLRTEAALRDTELRLQQSQKLEAVGRLAGGIAHDFNNLLTVITGFTQIVLEGLAPSDARAQDLREVQRAATRAAELTRQLLAFSRKQVLQPEVLDLDAVVQELDKMLRRVIGEHVELRTHREATGACISADRGQVEQVLVNLVVNARDAMPDGGTIRVRTRVVDVDVAFARQQLGSDLAPGRYVRLDVRDTGVGMDAAVRARIFEPFFTTKPTGTGTGLGLPMSYGIVRQSGGGITVESAPGEGTTVSLFFPAVGGVPAASVAPVGPAATRGDTGTETVLLVEDEDAVRDVARRILEAHGYRVLTARHAGEALEIARSPLAAIDLVLTDLVMPGLGGRALADRLAGDRPGLPVVFMSGYTDDAVLRREGDEAAPPLLMKPFTVEALVGAVRAALDRAGRLR